MECFISTVNSLNGSSLVISLLDSNLSLILIFQIILLMLILFIIYLMYFLVRKDKIYELELSKINHYQVDLHKREQELYQLRKRLDEVSNETQVKEKKDQDLLLTLIKTNDPLFLDKFKEMYPDFIEMLYSVNSNLTQNDLKYCILIKYNFSSKEIGDILNVSANSVGVKRHRIREKLQLSSKVRLNEWLNNV